MPRAQHTADVPKMSLKPNVSGEQCAGRARTTARLLGRGCARHSAQPRPLRAQVTELDVGERQGRDSNPSHRTPSPLSPPAKRVCEGRANLPRPLAPRALSPGAPRRGGLAGCRARQYAARRVLANSGSPATHFLPVPLQTWP